MVNTKLSPADTSSLAAPETRWPDESRRIMSCETVPVLTRKKTTFPDGTLMVEGLKEYSVIVTLVEPDGCAAPPVPPPHAARRASATSETARALIGTP